MKATAQKIDYDTTSIGSTAFRRDVDCALDNLRMRKREGVWDSIWTLSGTFPASQTVVVADLHRVSSSGLLDYWSAGPSTMSYVFCIRTALDRRRLRNPEIALRLNDEKFFLFDFACESPSRADVASSIATYFRTFIERLDADRVRAARFAPIDGLLWVEFGDGLERGVSWDRLPFAAQLKMKPVSASASDHGQSVLLLDASGREVDIDAGALRAVINPEHLQSVESDDRSERAVVGGRLRALREEQGFSQEELSARSGIPQESLSRLENGRRDPRLDTLRRLAAGYGLELSEVLRRLEQE